MNAFAAAMQRWGDLLTKLMHTDPASQDFQRTLQSLHESFASELEVWLRSTHPFAAQFGVPPQQSTQFALHGAGVGSGLDGSRAASLLLDWVRLQSQLAVHWTTIARAASERFMARISELAASGKLPDAQKLFAVWIDCAEEAYSETAHSDTFARLVSDLINTAVVIQLEGRQYVHEWARAADLPTRSEIDTLKNRIVDLERRVRRPPKKIRGKSRAKGKRRG